MAAFKIEIKKNVPRWGSHIFFTIEDGSVILDGTNNYFWLHTEIDSIIFVPTIVLYVIDVFN